MTLIALFASFQCSASSYYPPLLLMNISRVKRNQIALKSINRHLFDRKSSWIAMASQPPSKRQKSDISPYELIYHSGTPGRGEHIRLCFEATKTPYTDVCNCSKNGREIILKQISNKNLGDETNPPPLAPPMLKHGDLFISQLPNILLYLGPKLGLAGDPDNENAIYYINAIALTILDGLSNEAHDTHHPIANGAYYDEQKEEAKKSSADYIEVRLPKYIGYLERVLEGEASKGGEWLYGGTMTWADLVAWQGLDGVTYAFPKAMEAMKKSGKYSKVFDLYERVSKLPEIKTYLESEKRMKYGNGIYRYYPELDLQE